MSRVNKTITNLQKVWDRFDKAYENMETAFEILEFVIFKSPKQGKSQAPLLGSRNIH